MTPSTLRVLIFTGPLLGFLKDAWVRRSVVVGMRTSTKARSVAKAQSFGVNRARWDFVAKPSLHRKKPQCRAIAEDHNVQPRANFSFEMSSCGCRGFSKNSNLWPLSR